MKKKLFRKVIASILAVLMTFYSIELAGVLAAYASNDKEKEKIKLLECIPEDAEKRYEHVKHLDQYDTEDMVAYLNEDGTTTFYLYQAPIRYADENGDYQLYDNTIVKTSRNKESGYEYKNKSSNIDILFPEHLQGGRGVKIKKDNYFLELIPVPLQNDNIEQKEEEEPVIIPEVSPTLSVAPEVSFASELTDNETQTPEVTTTITIEPTASDTPEVTASLTQEPNVTPVITEVPTDVPTVTTTSPVPTISQEPTASPEDTIEPTTTPSPEVSTTPSPEVSKESGNLSVSDKDNYISKNIIYSEEKEKQAIKEAIWDGLVKRENKEVEKEYRAVVKDDNKAKNEDRIIEYKSSENEYITYSYSAQNNGFKENITLNKYSDQNEFDFILIAPDLQISIKDKNIIELTDKDENLVFSSNQMFAIDSHKEAGYYGGIHYTEEISMEIIASIDGEHRIRITVDEKFLKSKETVYPVYIDPTIYTISGRQICDTMILERNCIGGYPNYHCMGVNSTAGNLEYSFIKYNIDGFLNMNIDANNILSATYSLYQYAGTSLALGVYRMTRSWSPWIDFRTFDNYYNSGSNVWVSDHGTVCGSWNDIDITYLTKGWIRYAQGLPGGFINHGIMLKSGSSNRGATFYSAESSILPPVLTIQYEADNQAPQAVTSIEISSEGFTKDENNPGKCKATLEWDSAVDEPAVYYNVGVKDYMVYYSIDGTNYISYDNTWVTNTNKLLTNLEDKTEYTFKVIARDNEDNTQTLAEAGQSSTYTTPDVTSPKTPTNVWIMPMNWSNDVSPNIAWSDIEPDYEGERLTYQYAVDNTENWIDIGETEDINNYNLIANGDFSNGTANWLSAYSSINVDDNILSNVADGTASYARVYQETSGSSGIGQ